MSVVAACPRCGGEMMPDAPGGLCPRCLMAAGLASDADSATGAGATTPHPSSASGRRFVPPTPAELAAHFPQLEIVELIGSGGMGAVYKVRQKELERTVALKILPPQLGEDPSFAERFLREARAMARLSHPNIVAIFDFGRTGDLCYFTMEYVEGTNLRQVIKSERVASADALSLASQVCEALHYAHQEGVVHRDIKPENILVSKLGRVKITDFGLAKVVFDAAQASALTGTAELLGTFRYMAPEQLEQSRTVDHRADIYSLGIVLYELLTGEVPMGRFRLPSERVQSDPRIDEIVLRTLEREPERRFQTASDVKTALESLEASGSPSSGTSMLSSRWTSGMWSGIWSATCPRPVSGWIVACRLLAMLVAFAGLICAGFLRWGRIRVELIELPAGWAGGGTTIAEQESLGWQTLPGKLVMVVFSLVLLHMLANVHRLRWLRPTYGGFFVAGFAAVALSTWSLARPAELSTAPVAWQPDGWRNYLENVQSQPSESPYKTPREFLKDLAGTSSVEAENPPESQSNQELIEQLVRRGKLSLSSSYGAEAPPIVLFFGIGLVLVGLWEFVITYAAEPARRLVSSARSSVASRFPGDGLTPEPRISKMAAFAVVLALLPAIPFGFLFVGGMEWISERNVDYAWGYRHTSWLADPESLLTSASTMVGLAVLPISIGSLALYRIRRSRGLLHGLPLAFASAILWALVILDLLVIAFLLMVFPREAATVIAGITVPLVLAGDVYLSRAAWRAARQPLPRPDQQYPIAAHGSANA